MSDGNVVYNDEEAKVSLIYSIEFQAAVVIVWLLQCYFYRQRRAKQIPNNLFSLLFANYLLWWTVSNIYQIVAPDFKDDMLYWILLFPECIYQHVSCAVLFPLPKHAQHIRLSTALSMAVFAVLLIVLIVMWAIPGVDPWIRPLVLLWFYINFTSTQVAWIWFYKALKERGKWTKSGKFALWFGFFGGTIAFNIGFGYRIFGQSSPDWTWYVSGIFDLLFFAPLSYTAHYMDSMALEELTISYLWTGKKADGSDGADGIEQHIEHQTERTGSTNDKSDDLEAGAPAETEMANKE